MSNLTTLQLNEDKSVLSVGPAYRWEQVYSYLAKYDLAAAGGRLGPVGVPGLLLAGGVNFYGNQVGFGCNTVINYEVVLADGSLVNANSTQNSDLFWALKGGSSNFGLVTRFDLETIPSTQVWAGAYTVSAEYVDAFLAVCLEKRSHSRVVQLLMFLGYRNIRFGYFRYQDSHRPCACSWGFNSRVCDLVLR